MRFETVERRRVRFGTAEVARDRQERDAWLVSVDGVPQSYVDLDDPANLPFDVMRRVADVVDALPRGPLRALHIGGAACTLPRYIHHTRPGSDQLVVDYDGELVDLVNGHLPAPAGIEVRVEDGLEAIKDVDDLDLVVLDAFEGVTMPAQFAAAAFHEDVARALSRDKTFIVNVLDTPELRGVRRMRQAITARFGAPLVIADEGVLNGTGDGNVLLVATRASLPVTELDQRARKARFPARVPEQSHESVPID